jgi:hypothetical protein
LSTHPVRFCVYPIGHLQISMKHNARQVPLDVPRCERIEDDLDVHPQFSDAVVEISWLAPEVLQLVHPDPGALGLP